jgi:hypothetical protein
VDCHRNEPSKLLEKDALPNKGNLVLKDAIEPRRNYKSRVQESDTANPATDELRSKMQDARVSWETALEVCGV